MKKLLLHLTCAMALLMGVTSCDGFDVNFDTDSGNGDDGNKTEDVVIILTRCWCLKSFCGTPAEMDIIIDFGKDGEFAIYQRTDKLTYTVFNGTYTVDEENSTLKGIYDDGTPWSSSYVYTLNEEAREMVLESTKRPEEISVYEPGELPASVTTKCTLVNSVKPL